MFSFIHVAFRLEENLKIPRRADVSAGTSDAEEPELGESCAGARTRGRRVMGLRTVNLMIQASHLEPEPKGAGVAA